MAVDLDNLESLLDGLNGLNESQKFTMSEALFLEAFKTTNIKDVHPSLGEVRMGTKMPILGMEGGYDSFPYVASCALPNCNISADWSEFTWCIGEIGCEITLCMKDVLPKFLAFFNVWRKMNEGDIQSAFVQFISELFQDRHLKAEFRVAYLGDTDATVTVGEVDGEGEPIDEGDPLFNGCNGFITQMDAQSQGNTDLRVTISENQEATLAAQTMTGEEAYNYALEMYNKAAVQPWFNPSQMVYRLNRSIVNVLVGWLNSKADLAGINCACIDPSKVVGARGFTVDNLSMFGIPVEAYEFEQAMKASAYYWDGTKFTKYKNIMILARKDAMILGYETTDSLSQFHIGWDQRAREIFIQGSSMFGAGVPVPYFILGI